MWILIRAGSDTVYVNSNQKLTSIKYGQLFLWKGKRKTMENEMNRELFAEMQENREQMRKVKLWFQLLIGVELVFAVYMAGFSVIRTFGIIFAAAAVAYALMVNQKNERICRIGTIGHILAALFLIISSAVFCGEIFSLDSSGSAASVMAINGISHFTSVSPEELDSGAVDLSFLIKGLKAAAAVSMACSVLFSVLPLIFNIRAFKYCRINEELSAQPGYPYFNRDVEFAKAVKNIDRERRHRENNDIRNLTGYSREDDDDYYIYGDVSSEYTERYSGMFERFSDRVSRDPDYLKSLAFKFIGIKSYPHTKKKKEFEMLIQQAEQRRNDRMNFENHMNSLKNSETQQYTDYKNVHNPDSGWNSTDSDLASTMLSDLDK